MPKELNVNTRERGHIRRFLDFWQLTQVFEGDEACCTHRRRFLKPYQRRLQMVRDGWLYLLSAAFLMQLALPWLILFLSFATFLSFAFLDETAMPES